MAATQSVSGNMLHLTDSAIEMRMAYFLLDQSIRNPSIERESSSRYLKYSPYTISDRVREGLGHSVS